MGADSKGPGVQDARNELLKNLKTQREIEAKLTQDLQRFEDCDPEVLLAKRTDPACSRACSRVRNKAALSLQWVAPYFFAVLLD